MTDKKTPKRKYFIRRFFFYRNKQAVFVGERPLKLRDDHFHISN